MCAYVLVHVCVCIYLYVYMCLYMCVRMCLYMFVCIYPGSRMWKQEEEVGHLPLFLLTLFF